MMITNDTTNQETIQQSVGELFKVRSAYYVLIDKLEQQTGLQIDNNDIGTEIDYNHAGKDHATPEDVASILAHLKNDR